MEKYSLVGIDGNAFYIMGYVVKAMRECGKSKDEIDEYLADAKSSNYDHLICVSLDMVNKLNDECDNYCPMHESKSMSVQNRKLYESIMNGVNRSLTGMLDDELNEGWKQAALGAAMGLSLLGGKANAQSNNYFSDQAMLNKTTSSYTFDNVKPIDMRNKKDTKMLYWLINDMREQNYKIEQYLYTNNIDFRVLINKYAAFKDNNETLIQIVDNDVDGEDVAIINELIMKNGGNVGDYTLLRGPYGLAVVNISIMEHLFSKFLSENPDIQKQLQQKFSN